MQNGGHSTTDGEYLYVHLHDGEEYWIGTVNFSAVPVSVTLSVPASIDDHILVAMHWSFKYNCIVAMRTADGIFVAMQVGNQSSVNASDFQKVKEITGPHYTDCGLPQGNSEQRNLRERRLLVCCTQVLALARQRAGQLPYVHRYAVMEPKSHRGEQLRHHVRARTLRPSD